jgi:hypothetical protein
MKSMSELHLPTSNQCWMSGAEWVPIANDHAKA